MAGDSSSSVSSGSTSMSSAFSSITSALSGNSKNIVMFVLIIAVIGGVLYYVIQNDLVPGLNKFFTNAQGTSTPAPDGIGSGKGDKNAQLFLFKVEWCPHCKKAKPVFDEVEKELKGREINGYTVSFKTVDCEADPDIADKFKIDGYPTIKLVKDGEVIEYDAKPEKDKIIEFLQTVLSS